MGLISNLTQLSLFFSKVTILIACNAEVFAPESTLALMVGIPKVGKEHHSSLPTMTLSNIFKRMN